MYNNLADSYSNKLPSDALASYRENGWYSLEHKPGFRIIALNTNLGYTLNWWLMSNLTDQGGQLQWFADELLKAEKANEKVFVVGHQPPGKSDCWAPWNKKFSEIIIRFEAIIMAQFYGHTHNDETTIFFDNSETPPRPVNSLNVGVSTTAYTNINPGYKVYHVDGGRGQDESTWEMVDHEVIKRDK